MSKPITPSDTRHRTETSWQRSREISRIIEELRGDNRELSVSVTKSHQLVVTIHKTDPDETIETVPHAPIDPPRPGLLFDSKI